MQHNPENLADILVEAERMRRVRGSAPEGSPLPTNPKHRKRNKESERLLQLTLL